MNPLPRRRSVRIGAAVLIGVALLAATVSAVGYAPIALGPGETSQAANGTTLVSVQGFHFQGQGAEKKPARLVAAGEEGQVQWRYESGPEARWFYDVDPLPNGNVFVTSTVPGDTVLFEYDPENRTRVWEERFDAEDTHDADLIGEDEILFANMREYDEETGMSDDRVFVYDRSTDEIVWEWSFREHFANDTDGGFAADWTHVNDVDAVGDGQFLVSPRNFDQAIVIDRETKRITMRLGADGRTETLYEQHNPDMLIDEQGRPTIVVADSGNDRVVEYTYEDGANASEVLETPVSENEGHWNRTWSVDGFNWPRDADRLPNGNTLVTDSLHHRVVEVTPEGEVVWEFYAPWAPYDAERVAHGDGSTGPTIAEMDAGGNYTVHGGAGHGLAGRQTPSEFVVGATTGWPFEGTIHHLVERYGHAEPFFRPVWLSPWSFAYLSVGLVVGLAWGLGELVVQRRRVRRRLGSAWSRVRDRIRKAG